MSRLTDKKGLANFKAIKKISPDYVASNEELIYAKLGELEDLEEYKTNNCPIVLLFDSLKNGIYELRNGKMIHRVVRGIEENGLCVVSEFCKYPECDEKFYYQEHNVKWFFKEDKSE